MRNGDDKKKQENEYVEIHGILVLIRSAPRARFIDEKRRCCCCKYILYNNGGKRLYKHAALNRSN